ncbi:MAG: O-succinylhomoserine sulfhydrylase [Alphaproteobacteria bacterium]|jgi:O-succinylhomoserine sulfhydrylase|nr:O-succinylhomoserine sulfhydrylase [Alphaproteobacteria bacterium]
MSNGKNDLRPQTQLVRAGLSRSQFRETSEALYLNSGFVFENAAQAEAAFKGENDSYIYSRYGNPTVSVFEERLAALEGADMCRATATGMAAVFSSIACQVRAGERVVASRALFGSCHFIVDQILPRWGIETVFVDGTDLDEWEAALNTPTRAVFLESPSNPMLDLVDIPAVAEMAHAAGARMVVDNVFATPLYQKPLELGADIVVYSATKHIDGHGRCLGGAVLADEDFMNEHFIPFYRHTGPSMSPFNAWVMAKSLETLSLRVAHQSQASLEIAKHLETQDKIRLVRHPGLESFPQRDLAERQMTGHGTLVTIDLEGGKDAAFTVLDTLELVDISNNLGDAKSLACHPSTTTHSRLSPEERAQLGISDGVVRISIGLEDVQDLLEDLDRALAKV